MTTKNILAHIEETRAEIRAAEKASWEEGAIQINKALNDSGFCTSPNARKALLDMMEASYHRGYHDGSLFTVIKIMESSGYGSIADLLKQMMGLKHPVDPTLN